jgi:hypothetical protein
MSVFHRQSGTAALIAIAITTSSISPMFSVTPATAQIFRSQIRNLSIPAGVKFPVTYEKDKIVVTPDETIPLTVNIARNIIDRNGNVLIPQGSQLVGQLEPATKDSKKGSQFVARELVFPNGNRQNIDATSSVITRKEKISKGTDTSKILQDAAIGAGAASVIGLITDRRIRLIEPVLGAGAGAAASVLLRKKKVEVVVVKPQSGDLDVTLRSDLQLSQY